MTQLVSYAQNFEDVILHRALSEVQEGNYIDVGAQSALVDSVSRMFHDLGWHGVHVEPVQVYADQLEVERPGDVVLRVLLGPEHGTATFHEVPDTGLSTMDAGIATRHRQDGFAVRERQVAVITLDDVFARSGFEDIHWLKIDVEGFEADVIRGWNCAVRPWIVVVESTLPLTQVQSHDAWEANILAKGYTFAYFDGLNRFYVAASHPELLAPFGPGPNVFDDFSLSGIASQPFTRLLTNRADALANENRQIAAELELMRKGAAVALEQLERAEADKGRLAGDLAYVRNVRDDLYDQLAAVAADRTEHARIAHFWWTSAEALRVEVDAIKASRSWRLTAPLRSLRGGKIPSGGVSRHFARALLARMMHRVVSRPALARPLSRILSLTPGLKARLRRIAVAYGFVAPDSAQIAILDSQAHPAHPALSLRAARVLADLDAAMSKERR